MSSEPAPTTERPDLVERRSSAVRVVRLIARGEDCEVMLAIPSRLTSPGTPRWLALKRLRADRLGDQESRAALRREIELANALHHPNIPGVRDARPEARSPVMASDYIDGPDLATLLLELNKRGRRLDLRCAIGVVSAVAEALRYLHEDAGARPRGSGRRGGRWSTTTWGRTTSCSAPTGAWR